MSNFAIIYWSGTGNTEAIAEILKHEISKANHNAVITPVSKASIEMVDNCDVLVLGCPAMGSEELEDSEMQPFVESIKPLINGKKIALFGSYDWGDGEWIRIWHLDMVEAKAKVFNEDLFVKGYPDEEKQDLCVNFALKLCNF
ncbi:MAG: Flavodoxin [Alphaproteobacteria bacterium ADurb.Bin438]|nr:MAG: Flavodoxin [Alphaproteobacteria bacterium ADurb.Bin438]